jgi:predicted PurR-regulated permease PerM
LAPFALSMVLAYILDPLADRVEARGVGRSVAVMLLMVPAIGVLCAVVFIVLPVAFEELAQVLENLPVLFGRLAAWVDSAQAWLVSVDLPFVDAGVLAEQLRSLDSASVADFFRERQAALASWVWTGLLGVGRGLGSALTVLGYVALTPVLTFYLLRDWDRFTSGVAALVPDDMRPAFVSFARECDALVSSYLRGQLTVAISIGVLTGIGLALVSFPYAATLGLVVALFSIVPYLGLILSLIPAIVIALVSGSVGISLLKVFAVYGIAQLLDGTLITPRIVGDSVGIHPVWIVLALTLGGFFFGFAGLLIAVPVAAVSKLLIVRGLARYMASDFFRGGGRAPTG